MVLRLGFWLGLGLGLGLGLVLNRDRLRPLDLLVGVAEGDSELELLLRLGGTVELLPDGDVARVEDNVGGSRIGVAFKGCVGFRGDAKACADL